MKLVKMKNLNETWAIVILTIEYTPQRISTTHQYPRLGANVVVGVSKVVAGVSSTKLLQVLHLLIPFFYDIPMWSQA